MTYPCNYISINDYTSQPEIVLNFGENLVHKSLL